MMKLTENETEKLEKLQNLGFKYLARDKNGKLYAFTNDVKDIEKGDFAWLTDSYTFNSVASRLFKSITWEDKEPTAIEKLLEGVE